MKNQRSWRLMSELKPADTTVRVSKVIGKKDEDGNTFFPTIEYPTTVVLMSEDKKTFETCKATADGQGNLTFTKRWLSDDKEIREVESFKLSWLPWTYMFMTMWAGDLVATTEPNTWTWKQTFEDDVEVGKDLVVNGKIIHPNEMIFQDSKNWPLTLSQIIHVAGEWTEVLVMTEEDYEKLEEPRLWTIYLINDNWNIKKAYLSGNEYLFLDIIWFPVQTVLAPDSVFVVADEDGNKKITAETLFQYTNNSMWEPTNLDISFLTWTSFSIKYEDPIVNNIKTIPSSFVSWLRSFIIRKEWLPPTSPLDWIIINTSTIKDEYKTNWFVDVLDANKDYYYTIVSENNRWLKTYCDYKHIDTKKFIDFLLIWWWGWWGWWPYQYWWWWGAWWVIYIHNMLIWIWEFQVVIGNWWDSNSNGWDSSFFWYISKGWWTWDQAWWSWWGGGSWQWALWVEWQWHNGWNKANGFWWWWGAWWIWQNADGDTWGNWWIWIESDISWTLTQYAWGWWGWWYRYDSFY